MTLIAPTLQAWFIDRLTPQLQASPRTIASYRDTLRLLLRFVQEKTGTAPASLDWNDLDESLIEAFLEHLETERGNSARSRNLRLTAIRSLFKYAALRHPEHAATIARVLSIPPKRFEKRTVGFLTAEEATALIDAPLQDRSEGRRDRAMLALTIQAGLRVSELIALRLRRHHARHRRARPLPGRQRPKATVGPAHRAGASGSRDVAKRTSRPSPRPAIPDPDRTQAQPRRDRAPCRHPCRHRRAPLPVASGQEATPAHAAPQLRDVIAASRRRHHRHRVVARARRRALHPAVSARGPHDQRTGPRARHTSRCEARPLPASRHRARVSRGAVTMPTIQPASRSRDPPIARASLSTFSACRPSCGVGLDRFKFTRSRGVHDVSHGPVLTSGAGDMLIASWMTATFAGATGRMWCGGCSCRNARASRLR